jgi:signal transduction histidine kinase
MKPKVEAKPPVVRKSLKNEGSRVRDLEKRLAESLEREKATGELLQEKHCALTEALDQQTATSEILRVISSSPTDVQPVFAPLAANAARLCGAQDALILCIDRDIMRMGAGVGPLSASVPADFTVPITRGSVSGRAIVERRTLHVLDLAAEPDSEFPVGKDLQRRFGHRTMLAAPLLHVNVALGVICVFRTEVRPFMDSQIDLLKTFADQAVIAIENVRLFRELQEKNRAFTEAHAQVTEALEQQTATAEILRVISSSPTDIRPVLEAVAQNAARLCEANDAVIFRVDGDALELTTAYGPLGVHGSGRRRPISRGWVTGRAVVDRKTIHVHDLAAEPETEFPLGRALQSLGGHRTTLATPLLREDIPLGAILIRRQEVRPFTDKQIKLLETFAAQAVIAIENARLFQELEARNRELTEALDQQTATSEILRVMSGSPIDIQPVLDAVAEKATRLCDATDGIVLRVREGRLWPAAHYGPAGLPLPQEIPSGQPINRDWLSGRAVVERRTVHVPDLLAAGDEYRLGRQYAERYGHRTTLAVPMLREGQPVGVITVRRLEVRPFTDKQIRLLETFADQAVIAIENVRLFQELQARTRELGRSVEELKALGEVSQAVSSTLDLETVLTTIVARAVQLSAASGGGVIYEYDDVTEEFRLRATHGMEAALSEALQGAPIRLGEGAMGQAGLTRAPVQVADILDERALVLARVRPVLTRSGYRSLLAVPLLLGQRIMGGLVVWRRESGPFDPDVVNLLQAFATQSVLAIQNARLFRELEAKSGELEAASRHKSEFLANMSHELRTPLNAILGFNEMILGEVYGDVPPDLREPLTDIQNSGKHLLRLINNVLDLSKIEAGRMELALTNYAVQDTVERVRASLHPLAADKGLEFVASAPEDIPLAYGDAGRITQCLMNLAGNALKFTRQGRVGISVDLQGDLLVYRVADTGIGIAKDKIETVFAEFRQGDATITSEFGGTGLGLSITKKFVEMHRGRIWVESELGKGSTFFFAIPLRLAGGKTA